MHSFKWLVKPIGASVAIELAILVLAGIVTVGLHLEMSKTIAYMMTFAVISFLPVAIGALVVGGGSEARVS